MIQKYGMAHWEGGLKSGTGTVSTETGSLSGAAYGFAKRFGDEKGTNPEELVGAAHASCFAMALSANLEKAGKPAAAIDARSTVTLDMSGAPTVTKIHVDVTASVPGMDAGEFASIAEETKETCPISRLLKAAEITMDAKLA